MEKKVIVGNVCFIKDPIQKKVLLLKRNKEPLANKYTGVGGKTNFDEDIFSSCVREVKEETGIQVEPKLKGVVKTILENNSSSWILFVFTAEARVFPLPFCDEGELSWVLYEDAKNTHLIGFIKKLFPQILDDESFFLGTIKHDSSGNVISEEIKFL